MASIEFEAVAMVGKDKSGKARYHKCGAVFRSDKGLSLKLDSLPVGAPEWNGWISFYPPKPKDGQQPQRQAPSKTPTAPAFEDDSDIPF